MEFNFKIIEVAQNVNQGYRYNLQMVNGANQSNGNMNIVSPTPLTGYALGNVVVITLGTPAAPAAPSA